MRPRRIALKLNDAEIAVLIREPADHGFRHYHRRLLAELAGGRDTIRLDDAGLGELVRLAFLDGSSGYSARLRAVFGRSIRAITAGAS